MEIKKTELHKELKGSRAIITKNKWNDLHAINCRPKAQEYDTATSFLTQISWIQVEQTLRANNAPGYKR